MRVIERLGMAFFAVLMLGMSIWKGASVSALKVELVIIAALVLAIEGFNFLYLARWPSSRPTRAQSITNLVYSMLGAGSPLAPVSAVVAV